MSDKKPKHLIYYDWHLDIRAGGPPGYLANLRYGLDRIPNAQNYDFELWALKKQNEIKKKKTLWSALTEKYSFLNYLDANYFSKSKKRFYKEYIKFVENIDHAYIQDEVIEKIKNENIKMIHCHYVIDAIKVINTLKREHIDDVKVLLTSHMPEAPALENYNLFIESGYSQKKALRFKKAWEYIQKRAFTESDILVFPSKEAMEPYYDTIPQFSEWIKDKDIRYYQTGAKQLVSQKSKEELRKQYGVNENQKVVVFIGRHIEVKGYDVLVEAGKQILDQRKDTVFLIGGKQNTLIKSPRHSNWKELGWVNPAELLKIADVFILPNRRTYFDLILLEVMSTGTPVIATNTGGNKSVNNVSDSLILYDATAGDLVSKSNAFLDSEQEYKNNLSQKILEAYQNNYTPECFAQRYLDLIN